jgi:hypothetical protein
MRRLAKRVLPDYAQDRLKELRGEEIRLVPQAELERVYENAVRHLVEATAQPLGDYLEFGVFRGDSLLCMDRVRRAFGLRFRMFGFDSFAGLPDFGPGDEVLGWTPGSFRSTYETTARRLRRLGGDDSNIVLVKGWYSQTLTPELMAEHRLVKASTIMIDCDLYSSTREALEFCAPLVRDEAILFFDDWDGGFGLGEREEGESKAFAEFLAVHPEFESEHFDRYYHTEMESTPVAEVFRVRRRGNRNNLRG